MAEAAEPGKTLVIVESATKAKKIQPYLGDNYIVEASVGHIRDLPRGAADVPAKFKKESWARLGVNPEDDFAPLYVVSPDKKKKVADLKSKLKQCDSLLLATDPDREGEAIAWHLLEVLKPKVPVRRMVFNEITKSAILEAAESAWAWRAFNYGRARRPRWKAASKSMSGTEGATNSSVTSRSVAGSRARRRTNA